MEHNRHSAEVKLKAHLLDKPAHSNKNITNKEVSTGVKNGTIKKANRRHIIHTETKTVTNTTDTLMAVNKAEKLKKKPKDEPKNSLWSLKGNKENITNIKDKPTANTKRE